MRYTGRWPQSWRPLDHDPSALLRIRTSRGWSQRQLAAEVGISRSYMSEIEGGTRNANPVLLEKIAEVLRCPVSALQPKARRGLAA